MVTITLFVTMYVYISEVDTLIDLKRQGWNVFGQFKGLCMAWDVDLTSTQVSKTFKFTSRPLSNNELLAYIKAFNSLTMGHVEWATTSISDVAIWEASYIPSEDRYVVTEPSEEK